MENTTYIVDGQTMVDNIHIIKQWVYLGLIRVHIPLSSVETVTKLHQKSLESKETPKDDRQQKRQSGRPRKEYPLFDINPWTAKEFLERVKSETGLRGVTFQQESGEEFTQWMAEDEKAVNEQPLVPPSSFSEALLRKLNIAKPEDKSEAGSMRPKLVSKSSTLRDAPFRIRKTPTVNRNTIPEHLKSFLSAVLWKSYDYETNPFDPEAFAVLTSDIEISKLTEEIGMQCVAVCDLRAMIQRKILETDARGTEHGEVDTQFPDAPKRAVPYVTKTKTNHAQVPNGRVEAPENMKKPLETAATAVVEELLGRLRSDNAANPNATDVQVPTPLAELRPSISYAMAAGAKSQTPTKSPPMSVSTVEPSQVVSENASKLVDNPKNNQENVKPVKAKPDDDDEVSSDEEVVLFVGKKRRSQEASRIISRPASRRMTAVQHERVSSPKPAKVIKASLLKPQSPVFTPGQLYTPTSPSQAPGNEVQSIPISKDSPPTRRTSQSKPEGDAQLNMHGRVQNAPRTPRGVNGQNRHVVSEDAQRQSEMILQRQREAIKRSAHIQETQAAARAQQETKVEPRLIELSPTSNPVVIDPDDFGRDYTIRPHALEQGRARGKGGGRRGGRGRGARIQPQAPPRSIQQEGPKHEIDFVLKTGSPRGSTRGRGRLWVP